MAESKRMRFSGLPMYQTLDNCSEPARSLEQAGKCLNMDGIDLSSARSAQELLQMQLDAVNMLYRVYKVDHYALLEELRLRHGQFTGEGKYANKLEEERKNQHATTGVPEAGEENIAHGGRHDASASTASAPALPIKEMVRWKRSRARPTAVIDTDQGKAVREDAPTSTAPPESPMQQQSQPAQPVDMSSSPPGISLNMWMAPAAPANTNTPQSLRQGPTSTGQGASQNIPVDSTAGNNPVNTTSQASEPQISLQTDITMGVIQEEGMPHCPRYGDETLGYGSDDEPVTFTDIEDEILAGPAAPPPDSVADQVPRWRDRFASNASEVLTLEAIASASTQQELDDEQVLASLSGRSGRYLIRRPTILIGRDSEAKGGVDIDLASEGPAMKVSRRQAFLTLLPDGSFQLENVGRQALHVDGAIVPQFSSAPLGHLSLLEVGGSRLLFMVNAVAVQRILRRTARLVV